MDWQYLFFFAWFGSFLLISIDSAIQKIGPVFWRLAGLFGGPFALIAYGIAREQSIRKSGK